MAWQQIRSFTTNEGAVFQCLYDHAAYDFDVVSSTGEIKDPVTESELGFYTGDLMDTRCIDGDKVFFYAQTYYPFMYVSIERNSSECGYIPPPPVCDLAIDSVTKKEESYSGAFDGKIEVAASSSHGPIEYSLDNSNWQLSNVFAGLNAGNYTIYARDAQGCKVQRLETLSVLPDPLPEPVSPASFPWQEKLCYFFRLVVGGVETLISEPAKWDSVGIVGERDKDWHGWNAQYSDGDVQLEFDCAAGKELLENEYESKGNDAEVFLVYGYSYEGTDYILFEGKLDFNTYRKKPGIISMTVERKGATDILQSRFDAKIAMNTVKTVDESDITPPQAFDISLHAKQIAQGFTNVITEAEEYIVPQSGDGTLGTLWVHPNTTAPQLSEVEEFFGVPLNSSVDDPFTFEGYRWKIKFPGTYTFHIAYNIDVTLYRFKGGSYHVYNYFRIYRAGSDNNQQQGAVYNAEFDGIIGNAKAQFTLNPDYTVSNVELQAGDQIYFYSEIVFETRGTVSRGILKQNSVNITVSSLESAPSSTTKGWLLFDVVNHIIKSITNNSMALVSKLLNPKTSLAPVDGEFALYAITNGFNIRNFDVAKKPLNLSLKTSLNSTKAIAAIGFGFEKQGADEVVRVEKIEYFYQDRQILIIEECEGYDEEVAKELIYNEVEVGYNKYKEDGYNTLDEFNTRHEYLTPIKTHKNKMVQKSDFIASGYSIEDVRRQQYAQTATNSYENDEDPFIISLRRNNDALIAETNEAFPKVENLISPATSYNLRLSPARMLLNWGKWLSGSFAFKSVTEVLKNMFVDKNGDLITQFYTSEERPMGDKNKIELQEKASITIQQLNSGEYIYRPEWVNVKCRLRPDQVLLINDALRGMSDNTRNYGYVLVKSPEGVYNAIWPYKLTYNFSTERCELKGLKKFENPTDPIADCCPWLTINGCHVLINGQKVIL